MTVSVRATIPREAYDTTRDLRDSGERAGACRGCLSLRGGPSAGRRGNPSRSDSPSVSAGSPRRCDPRDDSLSGSLVVSGHHGSASSHLAHQTSSIPARRAPRDDRLSGSVGRPQGTPLRRLCVGAPFTRPFSIRVVHFDQYDSRGVGLAAGNETVDAGI
jgi:hypothetical protein